MRADGWLSRYWFSDKPVIEMQNLVLLNKPVSSLLRGRFSGDLLVVEWMINPQIPTGYCCSQCFLRISDKCYYCFNRIMCPTQFPLLSPPPPPPPPPLLPLLLVVDEETRFHYRISMPPVLPTLILYPACGLTLLTNNIKSQLQVYELANLRLVNTGL